MEKWYLLQCKSRQERRAQENLSNQGWEVFCPMVWVNKSKTVIPKRVYEPLFPGYLFIKLEDGVGNLGAIRSTRGVAGFVGFGVYPLPVQDGILQSLRGAVLSSEVGCDADVQLSRGDSVLVTEGCFEGLKAIYHCESGRERAVILLNIVGSNTAIQIDTKILAKL